jgi:hypothetical protein
MVTLTYTYRTAFCELLTLKLSLSQRGGLDTIKLGIFVSRKTKRSASDDYFVTKQSFLLNRPFIMVAVNERYIKVSFPVCIDIKSIVQEKYRRL